MLTARRNKSITILWPRSVQPKSTAIANTPILTAGLYVFTCTHERAQLLIAGHATGPERVFMAATTLTCVQLSRDRSINFLPRSCLRAQLSVQATVTARSYV